MCGPGRHVGAGEKRGWSSYLETCNLEVCLAHESQCGVVMKLVMCCKTCVQIPPVYGAH